MTFGCRPSVEPEEYARRHHIVGSEGSSVVQADGPIAEASQYSVDVVRRVVVLLGGDQVLHHLQCRRFCIDPDA